MACFHPSQKENPKKQMLAPTTPIFSSQTTSGQKLPAEGLILLAGHFEQMGVCVEHHRFELEHTGDWSPSFCPDSLEICLNLHGHYTCAGLERKAPLNSPSTLVYSTIHQPAIQIERHPGLHHFVSLKFSRTLLEQLFCQSRLLESQQRSQTCFWKSGNLQKVVEWPLLPEALDFFSAVERLGCPSRRAELLGQACFILSKILVQLSQEQNFFRHRWQRSASLYVSKAKNYLLSHLDEPFELKRLARAVGCSAAHLSRTFTQVEGMSLSHYLKQQRMAAAARLLSEGSKNVTEVSLEVGYNSLSHFSRTFSETYGCSPANYTLHPESTLP